MPQRLLRENLELILRFDLREDCPVIDRYERVFYQEHLIEEREEQDNKDNILTP